MEVILMLIAQSALQVNSTPKLRDLNETNQKYNFRQITQK
jgi:hypothetical protein